MCCYNSQDNIIETLNSIKSQTYKKWELIIVNDGSNDKTENIVKEYINLNKKLNISYFYQHNHGLATSRNNAINKTNFDWIAIIDHDDIWIENKLEIQAKEIKHNLDKKLFFSDFWILNNKDKVSRFDIFSKKDFFNPCNLDLHKHKAYLNLVIFGCFIASSTVIFDKNVIKKVGYFNSEYQFVTDYIFYIEVAKEYDIHCTNLILSYWRKHASQASNKMSNIYYIEMFKLFNKVIFFKTIKINIKLKVLKKYFKLIISFLYRNIN